MYRIAVADVVITKPIDSLEEAQRVREELHRFYFNNYDISELVIIDEDGNIVECTVDENRKK